MIPTTFWSHIGSSINLITVMVSIFLASKAYRNVRRAHQRPIYHTVEYHDCVIEKEHMGK